MTASAECITFDQLEDIIYLVDHVHGFNFYDYSRASLKRRVTRVMNLKRLDLFDLKNLLVNDEQFLSIF